MAPITEQRFHAGQNIQAHIFNNIIRKEKLHFSVDNSKQTWGFFCYIVADGKFVYKFKQLFMSNTISCIEVGLK